MICAFLCDVLRVTKMSVDKFNVEMMMCMVNDDDEEEDFRILRWLTFAG